MTQLYSLVSFDGKSDAPKGNKHIMYYAKFIRNAEDTPTVGAIDGQPLNFSFAAFETQAERQAAIDTAWQNGGNGFKVTRKEVEGFYGRSFEIDAKGGVWKEGASDIYSVEEYEQMMQEPRIWEKAAITA